MATITVLYFCNHEILTMNQEVLTDLEVGIGDRVIIPSWWRAGKTIVAVIEGEANVLNMTGERIVPNLDKAVPANEEQPILKRTAS